jgi:hypothetical protein
VLAVGLLSIHDYRRNVTGIYVRFREANRSPTTTGMVKVFGCRPSQVARLGTGRRTETAHVRTRGQRARRYGDLRIPLQRCRGRGACDLPLAGDGERRRRSLGGRVGRCRGGRPADLAVIGTAVELAVDLGV